ncbi:MAG: ATP-grasp domain-containing protein [Lachnospiraceae bacterium]|nr:ATP-grasp domain-containing protein [Lachnospiraceae bacterium]
MNILILSCGTRNKLVRFFKETLKNRPEGGNVIVTDCSEWAPALYEADAFHIVPRMTEPGYLEHILDICKKEKVNAVLPLFEDELDLIAQNRQMFEAEGIVPVVSEKETVALCRDKYLFYQHLVKNNIPALPTCLGLEEFDAMYAAGKMDFPVFVKPVNGCGSVGISKVEDRELLEILCRRSEDGLLIQQFADGEELGADIYVDLKSQKPTAIFTKKKVRMRAGETEKSVSVKDETLFALIEKTVLTLKLAGPVDMDIFKVNGQYFISEINPRFGGGYPHAYHCNVKFPELIAENLCGRENRCAIGEYEEGICMMKYSDEIVRKGSWGV